MIQNQTLNLNKKQDLHKKAQLNSNQIKNLDKKLDLHKKAQFNSNQIKNLLNDTNNDKINIQSCIKQEIVSNVNNTISKINNTISKVNNTHINN
jgi:hypothetical protein